MNRYALRIVQPLSSAVLLGLLWVTPAWTGLNIWTSGGPEGAQVFQLAQDPGNSLTVYCAPAEGLYRTLDAGQAWTRQDAGLGSAPALSALAVDESNGLRMYCTVEGQGFFKSSNGGNTWSAPSGGQSFASLDLDGIEVSRANPDLIYTWISGPPGRVYLSTDGGDHFQEVAAQGLPLAQAPLTSLLACSDAANSLQAFAGFDEGWGLYLTADGGNQWFHHLGSVGYELPNPMSVLDIAEYADSAYWTWVAIGTRENGVWVTDGFGGRWFHRDGSLPSNSAIRRLWSHPGDPDDVYALVDRVDNTREIRRARWTITPTNWTWSLVETGSQSLQLAGPSGDANTLWSGGTDGLRYSIDRGSSWESRLQGFFQANVNALSHANPYVLGILFNSSLVWSSDNAQSWSAFVNAPTGPLTDCLLIPSATGIGTHTLLVSTANQGIQASGNTGTSWSNISVVSELSACQTLWAGPNTSTCYAITASGGVYRGENQGTLWNWSDLSTGLPLGMTITALALDSHQAGTLYVLAGQQGIWEKNGTAAWFQQTNWPAHLSIQSLDIDRYDPQFWYAGTEQGAYWSQDGGSTWSPYGLNINRVSRIWAGTNTLVYAVTENNGVYWRFRQGTPWTPLSAGYPASGQVLDAGIDLNDQTLFASISAHGVYAYTYTGSTPQETTATQRTELKVFPNPARGAVAHIQFEANQIGECRLVVLNIAGRMVSQVTHQVVIPGPQIVEFQLADIANGVYLLYVRQGNTQLGSLKFAIKN